MADERGISRQSHEVKLVIILRIVLFVTLTATLSTLSAVVHTTLRASEETQFTQQYTSAVAVARAPPPPGVTQSQKSGTALICFIFCGRRPYCALTVSFLSELDLDVTAAGGPDSLARHLASERSCCACIIHRQYGGGRAPKHKLQPARGYVISRPCRRVRRAAAGAAPDAGACVFAS